MKIAYLIQAHNNVGHLERLIKALDGEGVWFFLHIDKKADIGPFAHLAASNVTLVERRVAVYWGDFTQVEATLVLIEAALASPAGVERLVFISGADYPIRTPAEIDRYFAERPQAEFINTVAMPADAMGKPITRLTRFHPRPSAPRAVRGLQKVMMRLGLLPRERDYRQHLRGLQPYGGSSWWALTRPTCEHVMRFVAEQPAVVAFFKNTWCPDESFFQTIIGNTEAAAHVVPNLTYTDWAPGAASPEYMSEKHLPVLHKAAHERVTTSFGETDILFARKFSDQQAAVVGKLARQVAQDRPAS
jgi:hypothetical protein